MKRIRMISKSIFSLALVCLIISFGCNRKGSSEEKSTQDTVYKKAILGELEFENDTIDIYKIDSVAFFDSKKTVQLSSDTLPYISDFEVAKKLLKGRVIFGGYNNETGIIDSSINEGMIFKINFPNGKKVLANEQHYFWDVVFWRYYPTENILLCEGGHSSDYSFDLKNAVIGPDLVGNPDYIVYSPSKQYRLNGWFLGQECSSYFIQKLINGRYQFLIQIPIDLSEEQFDLCTITDIFWISETELFFRNTYFSSNGDPRLGFFRLKIKE